MRERFWARVDQSGDCWVWTGGRHRSGHGIIGSEESARKVLLAHRYSYEMAYGPIPEGMVVMHRCDNAPCVNPDHLEAGTRAQNNRDAVDRLGVNRGERHPRAKLDDEAIRTIRSLRAAGVSNAELASRFGVQKPAISRIATGHSWRHVA